MRAWLTVAAMTAAASMATAAAAPTGPGPWADARLSPDQRARLVVRAMTRDEKFQLIRSQFAIPEAIKRLPLPPGAIVGVGHVPGIARLGIPALRETDAGQGVTQPGRRPKDEGATALPSGLAIAASWDPRIARAGGAMIAGEARYKGFNVLLAGGINLMREPRNGRNFEYAGEDPLLAGRIVGESIRAIQSRHVLSTIKHFALNDQETARMSIDVRIGEQAMHESDLLAFRLAIERGRPGAVMCAYNRVNGDYACEHDELLNRVLKRDWRYPGFVMSDWGAVHSAAKAANAGLDQQSAGESFDDQVYFDGPLRQALRTGEVPAQRLDDMVQRILRSLFAAGLYDHPVDRPSERPSERLSDRPSDRRLPYEPLDVTANLIVARDALEAGAVLLRNEQGLLPLNARDGAIAVIGRHIDKGVLAGGGSSLVRPRGGNAVPGIGPTGWPGPVLYDPNPPLKAIRDKGPTIAFNDGRDAAAAARLARNSHTAVVFVEKWATESVDSPDLTLPDGQDALVSAVAQANPRTVVVVVNNGPVAMPWLQQVGAVLVAWYPGSAGSEAIANLLFGKVSPSGRLPFTWPRDLSQLPRPLLEGAGLQPPAPMPASVDYDIEGADVGYRWFQRTGRQPLFPFGHGLSYTTFTQQTGPVRWVRGAPQLTVTVRNTGSRAGADVVQVYAAVPDAPAAPGVSNASIRRLAGFAKTSTLRPGARQTLRIALEPRLLAHYDPAARRFTMPAGRYELFVGRSAIDLDPPHPLTLATPRPLAR
ncbi:MAG TPA: glycoside hydrolase family 3 C-terminal domain-containing protein [Burkholderiaceae bacterium]|nr:glycoside hydrolase family 3 C-terminal domain-containing protein [Burkholderiaceae bacterium]